MFGQKISLTGFSQSDWFQSEEISLTGFGQKIFATLRF